MAECHGVCCEGEGASNASFPLTGLSLGERETISGVDLFSRAGAFCRMDDGSLSLGRGSG